AAASSEAVFRPDPAILPARTSDAASSEGDSFQDIPETSRGASASGSRRRSFEHLLVDSEGDYDDDEFEEDLPEIPREAATLELPGATPLKTVGCLSVCEGERVAGNSSAEF
ncbi:unnamed protein product, partial [Effrenium voratum]